MIDAGEPARGDVGDWFEPGAAQADGSLHLFGRGLVRHGGDVDHGAGWHGVLETRHLIRGRPGGLKREALRDRSRRGRKVGRHHILHGAHSRRREMTKDSS